MKFQPNFLKNLSTIFNHWQKWKWDGVKILFKRFIYKNQIIRIKLKGFDQPIYLRNNTSDITVFYQVFFDNSYNLKYDPGVEVILDCGANIGMASIFYSLQYPNARIVAIEPEEENFKILLKNTILYRNVIPIRAGIWYENTELEIINNKAEPWVFQLQNRVNTRKDSCINAISIPYLMKKYSFAKIDILKIDIEGSEKELFQENTENWLPLTKIICIELHDHLRPGSAKSFFNALNLYDYKMLKKKENLIVYL